MASCWMVVLGLSVGLLLNKRVSSGLRSARKGVGLLGMDMAPFVMG